MRFLITLVTLVLSSSELMASPSPNDHCLSKHLSEAIELNGIRRPLYSELSSGQSKAVSDLLMVGEHMGLITAIPLEALEKPLRDEGIFILCEDLVPMSLAPAFGSKADSGATEPFVATVTESVRKDLFEAWQSGGYEQLALKSGEWLEELSDAPPHHCMVHHLIESIARASTLAPEQLARAQAMGKASLARAVIDTFLFEQIALINTARKLDQLAAPLQSKGLPIICHDVPPIPVPGFSHSAL